MSTIIEKHLPLLLHAQSALRMGCWEWNTQSNLLFWTEGMFRIFDIPVSADDHIQLDRFFRFIHADDLPRVKKSLADLKEGQEASFRVRITTPHGEQKHVLFTGSPNPGNRQQGTVVWGWCQDITHEKTTLDVVIDTKDELELQLKTYQRAEQVAKSGTWQVDLNTHDTFYSDNTFRLYGLSPQSLPSHLNTFAGFIHPEEKQLVSEASELAFRNKLPLHLEYRVIRNDGAERYVRVISEVTRGLTGEELLTGIIQDITEHKLLEQELKQTTAQVTIHNKHFLQAERLGRMGSWQIDLATRQTWYSDNLYRLYGLKPGQVPMALDSFLPFIFNEDRHIVEAAEGKAFEGIAEAMIEFRITRQDGRLRYFRQGMQLIQGDSSNVMLGVVYDITDQKVLDEKLHQLNKELALQNEVFIQAEQTANIGTWRWNLSTGSIFYSDNIYRIYGIKPQSIPPGFEHFSRFFHPDDVQRLREMPGMMQKVREPFTIEYRIYRADGELRYLRGRNKVITTAGGEEIFIGTTQDVTEELQLRNRLAENNRFTSMLNNNLLDQLIVTNTSNTIIEFNRAAETVQGLARDSVIGRNFFEVFPQSKSTGMVQSFNRALAGELVCDRHIPSSLNKAFVDRYHIPVKDEQENVVGVLTIIRDVTAEYRLQQELREKWQFNESLLDASVARVFALDQDLNYTTWNRRAAEFYGQPKEKIIGKNLLEFNPGFRKQPLYDQLKKAMAGEQVYIAPNETAREGYHEAHLVPLRDDKGQVSGVLWIINDLTERRESEKAVEESRNLLQQTAIASPDAITIYNLETRQPHYLNDRLADWIGVSSEMLTQMGAEGRLQLIHPDDKEALLAFNDKLRSAGDADLHTVEYRLFTKKRHYIHVRNRSKVFKRDAAGNVTHLLSVIQNTTEQGLPANGATRYANDNAVPPAVLGISPRLVFPR